MRLLQTSFDPISIPGERFAGTSHRREPPALSGVQVACFNDA